MKKLIKFNVYQFIILILSHIILRIFVSFNASALLVRSVWDFVRGFLYDVSIVLLIIFLTDLFLIIFKKLPMVGKFIGILLTLFILICNMMFAMYFEVFLTLIPPSHLIYLTDTEFIKSSYPLLGNIKFILLFIIIPIVLGIPLSTYLWKKLDKRISKIFVEYKLSKAILFLFILFISTGLFYQIAFMMRKIVVRSAVNEHYLGVLPQYFKQRKKLRRQRGNIIVSNLSENKIREIQKVRTLIKYLSRDANKYIFKEYPLFYIPTVNSDYIKINNYLWINPNNSFINIKNKKINVIIIMLESFRACDIGVYCGKDNLTPNFDRLSKQGILFTDFWANARGTRHGEVSILYSVLAPVNEESFMKHNPLTLLIGLPTIFESLNYKTFWIHNGNSSFDNQKGFFLSHNINLIIDEKYFEKDIPHGSWGYSEKALFRLAIKVFNNTEKPFFAAILTSNLHMPYILPKDGKEIHKRTYNKDLQKRADLMHYCDEALGLFFELAKKEKWYKDTIFVITADEGGRLPKAGPEPVKLGYEMAEVWHKIPLLILGKGIKPRKINRVGSQADILPTLLGLLGIKSAGQFMGEDLIANANSKIEKFFVIHNDFHPDWVMAKDFVFAYFPKMGKRYLFRKIKGPQGNLDVYKQHKDFAERLFKIYKIWEKQFHQLIEYNLFVPPEVYKKFISSQQ